MKAIIGKKLGMTRLYDENGVATPVTVLEAGPCVVVAVKTPETDGYSAVQLGFGERKAKNLSKAYIGHCSKSGIEKMPAKLNEFRVDDAGELKVGSEVKADVFAVGDFLDVSGMIKGRGYQGVVKRYNFGGGRASHGGGWTRRTGSIGQCEFPGRVDKGKKMPGQTGNVQRTIQNLQVVRVDAEDNLLFVRGAVPGATGGILRIRKAIKK